MVIDINEGFKPQTIECIEILKHYKTPFVIAANKIDNIGGWVSKNDPLIKSLSLQNDFTQKEVDKKLYDIIIKLSEYSLNAERFDKVDDYTKQIAIIPTSAKTGDGIPELLMVLTGLAQRYLENSLKVDLNAPAKGIILEVKEEKGLGTTLDVIIYNGTIKQKDTVVIGNIGEPIVTKVKGLFVPTPFEQTKFKAVNQISAAAGVKINALDIDNVISGMPIVVAHDVEKAKHEIQKEVEEVIIETDNEGIILKADSIGSLEALVNLIKAKGIPIKSFYW